MRTLPLATLLLALVGLGGCTRDVIPNTDVEDTPENREVIEFVEKYRHALEERDTGKLLALASERYLDDNGTPGGRDDIDYERLQERLASFEDVLDVRYEIRYRRITYARDKVLVDYLYTGRFLVRTAEGERWSRRLSDNRIVLTREGEDFRIVSGM